MLLKATSADSVSIKCANTDIVYQVDVYNNQLVASVAYINLLFSDLKQHISLILSFSNKASYSQSRLEGS